MTICWVRRALKKKKKEENIKTDIKQNFIYLSLDYYGTDRSLLQSQLFTDSLYIEASITCNLDIPLSRQFEHPYAYNTPIQVE